MPVHQQEWGWQNDFFLQIWTFHSILAKIIFSFKSTTPLSLTFGGLESMIFLHSSGHFMLFLAQNVQSKLSLPQPPSEVGVGEHQFVYTPRPFIQFIAKYIFVNLDLYPYPHHEEWSFLYVTFCA